jgi:hypothetical protein
MSSRPPSGISRRIGRVTIVERPGSLIVSSAFLAPRRAVALAVLAPVALGFLGALVVVSRPRWGWDAVAIAVVFGVGMYFASILALNRTIATIGRDHVVVRRAPIPMWRATTIDAARIESVYATVATGFAGRGGRVVLDAITASVTDGRPITLIDDAGDAADAASVATVIAGWLGSHGRST